MLGKRGGTDRRMDGQRDALYWLRDAASEIIDSLSLQNLYKKLISYNETLPI